MKQIDPRDLLVDIAKILNRLKIPYIVTGGIAVLIWGRPRFTADIDIVVELKEDDIDNLERGLSKLGKAGYFDTDLMRQALAKRSEFNFIDWTTGVKVDFWILKENDAFDASRIKRRVAKKIFGEKVYFSSAEDLILIKLLWHKMSPSERQLDDARSIFRISGEKLDMKYLTQWAKKLGVFKILNKLL